MKIEKNFSLKNFNTYKINCVCKYFCTIETVNQLKQVIQCKEFKECKKHLVLGGGSNLLLIPKKYNGIVIYLKIKKRKIIKQTNTKVYIEFGAGENWNNAVKYCTKNNFGGIENLAYIPGTVGGAAVQNIAAYDQNLEDCFYKLTAVNYKTLETKTFSKKECNFEYRSSIFKSDLNKWVVTHVILVLNKNNKLDTKYFETGLNKTNVQQELEQIAKPPYTIFDMYKAIVSLRKKRIPEDKKFPNCGSFFKNPVVTKHKYLKIKKDIPNLQFYPTGKVKYVSNKKIKEGKVKISCGQLFDLGLNLRGRAFGNVTINEKNAAFIVNNGKATGAEIKKFSEYLKQQVYDKYKIKLEEEVRIIQ